MRKASRLARNGRDWHHLIELCGVVGVVVIDPEGIYDPRVPNDRLLLGLKGTMNEFELHLFRQRSFEAMRQKARRGEFQFPQFSEIERRQGVRHPIGPGDGVLNRETHVGIRELRED